MVYRIVEIETGNVVAEMGTYAVAISFWQKLENNMDYDIVKYFYPTGKYVE